MTIAQGFRKQTIIKRQSAKGTLAGASGAQIMRRETSTFELTKETYTTESEITSSQQLTSNRHGVRTVNGSLTGILSAGTYSDPLSAILRRDFAAVSALTGLSLTVAGTGPSYTITRAAGDFLASGLTIGMVIRLTAGSFAVGNLNKNLLITGITATVLTVLVLNGSLLTAEGPIATATISVPGKVTYTPVTGQIFPYHTVEEFYPDAAVSERNIDVKFISANIQLPGTGNAKIDFTAIGLNQTQDTAAYFTTPSAETTTDALVAASGALLVDGVKQATVTDLSFSIDGKGAAADGTVGTDIRPDVFSGKVMVSGSFTCYFEGGTVPALFVNETETSIVSALTDGAGAAANFISFALYKVKLNSSTPDDQETGLKRTYQFVATLNSAGGTGTATEKTTLQVHDSAAA